MSARRRPRLAAVLALALSALAVSFVAAPSPAIAAGTATFGQPSATATYGRDIVFDQPLTLTAAPRRLEILITFPGSAGPVVNEVQAGSGSMTATYTLDTPAGQLSPNSRISARWRVTGSDGSMDVGPEVSVVYADTRFTWRTRQGSLVRIHWYNGPDSFGQRALDIGERAVEETSKLLGVTETEPIDFFVYADQQAFYEALGPERQNVGGLAILRTRTLFAWITPDTIDAAWVGVVVPHELVHLVVDSVVHNPYHGLPKWVDEGVATYLSQGYDSTDRAAVTDAARNGTLIPLSGLASMFPASADRFSLAYAESAAAIDYLIRTYGRDALVALLRSYAQGRPNGELFKAALGVDVAGFDAAWRADIHAAEPKPYGPQPAPAGPLPPGWAAASGGPGAPGTSESPSAVASPAASALPGAGGAGSTGSGPNGAVVAIGLIAIVLGGLGVGLIVREGRPAARRRGTVPGASRRDDAIPPGPLAMAPPDGPAESAPRDETPDLASSEPAEETAARSPWDRPS